MNRYVIAEYTDPGIPEYKGNKFIEALPPILAKDEIGDAIASIPHYDRKDRELPAHLRLHCLQRLFKYFEPLPLHIELEQRFSILLRQGYLGRNPESVDFTHHLRNGYRRVVDRDLLSADYNIQSTAASFSMIGISGAGKSTSIQNVLKLYPQVIEHDHPISLTQIVWLKIDCPPDGSHRSLCINFFQHIDQLLGTNYEAKYVRPRVSADVLMGYMPMIANLHGLGVLIIDEVQNLSLAKSGGAEALLNFFVTLVNTIGLPVILIGTMKALSILQGDFRHARRSAGIGSFTFDRLSQGKLWDYLLDGLWRYQWTKEPIPLTKEIRDAFYDESQGITDVLVKLYALVQHRAISSGREKFTIKLIKEVSKESLKLIRPMIDALRSGDPRKIREYSDIHVPSFNELTATPLLGRESLRIEASNHDDIEKYIQVHNVLLAAGADSQISEFLIRDILHDDPNIDPLIMVERAVTLFRSAPALLADPEPKTQTKSAKKVSAAPMAKNDLRYIVDGADNAYDVLLRAGLIKKPLSEFSVLH